MASLDEDQWERYMAGDEKALPADAPMPRKALHMQTWQHCQCFESPKDLLYFCAAPEGCSNRRPCKFLVARIKYPKERYHYCEAELRLASSNS